MVKTGYPHTRIAVALCPMNNLFLPLKLLWWLRWRARALAMR